MTNCRKCRTLLFWLSMLALFGGEIVVAQQGTTQQVGQGVQFNLLSLPSVRVGEAKLREPTAFAWKEKPLRDGLLQLADNHQVSIWLDRRIDPSQAIDYRTNGAAVSLKDALSDIAAEIEAEASLIENTLYIGPIGTGPKLQRAAVELHDAITQRNRDRRGATDAELQMMSWPDVSSPSEIFSKLAEQWGFEAEADLPHDLWHESPIIKPCTLATQLVLLGSGFGLEPRATSAGFRFVPLDDRSSIQATFKKSELDPSATRRSALTTLQRSYGGRVQIRGEHVSVQGPVDLHLKLLKVAERAKSRGSGKDQPITFEVKNQPVKAVIDYLAQSLDFSVTWAESCGPNDQAKMVSFEVNQGSLDDVLKELADASGLRIDRDGDAVRLSR